MTDGLKERVDSLAVLSAQSLKDRTRMILFIDQFQLTLQGIPGLRKRLDKIERRLEKLEEK